MTSGDVATENVGINERSKILVLLITYASASETRSIVAKFEEFVGQLHSEQAVRVVVWDNKAWNLSITGEVKYHSSPYGNLGFGAAVNRVAELYDFERILLLNSDIDIDEKLFAAVLSSNSALADNVIWSPSLINPDGTLQTTPGSLFMRTPLQEIFDLFGYPAKSQRRQQPLYYLRGAVFSISQGLLNSVGGFDESFFLYGEEADLCFRLDGRCKLVMDDELRVIHHGSQGHKNKTPEALNHSLQARVLLHRKYNGAMASLIVRAAVGLAKCALATKRAATRLRRFSQQVVGR
ncbi:GT2 family glycosyltransferase [Pseudarthrobacter oxydans]|uniref:GT2 family glycosyltransferase n=1 Tax=Pseudarthrobacter oxydans TaxID=1671 RepID=A0AAW8N5B3_PSEOX|nr:hypothetical protein [Pseudarthrobacter oxydans]MDR6790956.1 GT2 family glycosyltransferase [Pseudarthrobacter oxydans]MDR7162616.1 GT2 family glycosyltransferase [Pseudarthrobacter oxydans]